MVSSPHLVQSPTLPSLEVWNSIIIDDNSLTLAFFIKFKEYIFLKCHPMLPKEAKQQLYNDFISFLAEITRGYEKVVALNRKEFNAEHGYDEVVRKFQSVFQF